jgi:hypothetical protein
MKTTETDFVKAICIALCKRKDVRVWRQNSGKSVAVHPKTRRTYAIQMAPEGAADISGIYKKTGQRIEIEVKADGGKLRPAQNRWRSFAVEFRCIYVLATYDEEMTMDANIALFLDRFDTATKPCPPVRKERPRE